MLNFNQPWSMAEGSELASTLFQEVYGYAPSGVWSGPGRVNIIGEHTDYNGGLALPIALPHRAYLAASIRQDRLMRLVDEAKEVVEVDLDVLDRIGTPGELKSWAAYIAGVLWAAENQEVVKKGNLPGFDVALRSCVPRGGGLSSSAALETSMALAMDNLMKLNLSGSVENPNDKGREQLVKLCVSAENDIAGAPTGGMDQSASLRARKGHALMLDCSDNAVKHVPFDLDSAGLALLVIDTRASHSLNDGQYANRRATCEQAAKLLGVKDLRQVYEQAKSAGLEVTNRVAELPDVLTQKRTRHVLTEIARTADLVELLENNSHAFACDCELEKIGQLLNDSHDSLRDDYEVTCPELDIAVDTARAAGAIGARMTGGGFGGSAIALVKANELETVAKKIALAYAEAGFQEPHFLLALPSEPAA